MRKSIAALMTVLAALAVFIAPHSRAADLEFNQNANADSKIMVLSRKHDDGYSLKASDFYLVYQIYIYMIRALGVDQYADKAQIEHAISALIANLKLNNLAQLQVKDYPGDEPLRMTLSTNRVPNHDKRVLFLVTNFHTPTKRTSSDRNLAGDFFGTVFYIVDGVIVKYDRMDNPPSKEALAAKSINSQADHYLLDGDKSNDSHGKRILIKALKSEKDPAERAIMHMTLSQYYLLEGNYSKARQAIDAASRIIDAMVPGKQRDTARMILGMADDFYRYYLYHMKTGRK